MVAAISASGKLVLLGLSGSRGSASISAVNNTNFPLFARFALAGAQVPNTSANQQAFAQAPFLVLGAAYPSALPSNGMTRDQIVLGCKSYVSAGTKNAILPIILQYQDLPNLDGSGNTTPWTNKCIANNWRLWVTGSSGTLVTSFGANGSVVPCHGGGGGGVAAIAVDPGTGLWPYQWGAQYFHDRYIGGAFLSGGTLATDTTFSTFGSTNLDGLCADDMTEYLRVSGDWIRNGTTQSNPGSSAVMSALYGGQADMPNYFHSLETTLGANRKMLGNTASFAVKQYGFNNTAQSGVFDYTSQESAFGRGISSYWQYYGFSWMLSAYQGLIAESIGGAGSGSGVLTGQYKTGDDQMMRHDLLFTLVFGNGYWQAGLDSSGLNDFVDPNNSTTWAQIDELWGGALEIGGYLGAPVAGPAGAPQTVPWNGSIYRRDFVNGIALFNGGSGVSGPYDLGGTFYHLRTVNGQAINDASVVSTAFVLSNFTYNTAATGFAGNSFTCGDSCILMRTPT